LGGGIANSTVWCQIFADVLDCPIIQLKSNDTETLGDVILAAQSVEIKEIPCDFGKKLAQRGTLLTPNSETTSCYQEQFAKYRALYANIKELF